MNNSRRKFEKTPGTIHLFRPRQLIRIALIANRPREKQPMKNLLTKTSFLALSALFAFTSPLALSAAEPAKLQQSKHPDAVPEGLISADWASIRQEYERHRHAVFAVGGGYQARNPEQQWLTKWDGRGFLTQPNTGGWTWGLELTSYGFEKEKQTYPETGGMTAEGARVTYERDAALQEWFANDQRGLEHGFTVEQRPAGSNHRGRLQFDLTVRGDLRPQVSPDGAAISFVDSGGAAVVTYSALKVWDADGKILPSRFEIDSTDSKHETSTHSTRLRFAQGRHIKLSIDERDAHYPITIDPIAQQAYLKASNTEANDFFAFSVAVSNDTVVVGATGEDSNATGVNGNQSDNSASNAGAAYVFVRNGATWTQQAYLKASNTDVSDLFGDSVAISGDTIVVGAPLEDSSANGAPNAGAAYVFVRSGTTWTQQAYLKASNSEAGDQFGISVAVSGDTIIIGAPREDGTSNTAFDSGAAYVFVRSGTTWSQQAYLKASNAEANDIFGQSVGISGETAVVGAYAEASAATGVNGDQSDNSASLAGAAYVFVRSGTSWTQQAYLKASNTDAGDAFGWSVAVSGDTAVVGATNEDSSATGVNGNGSDNNAAESGAAYVFVRSGTTWSQQAYLKASNTDALDELGYSVAISGNTVVVGAVAESSDATGVDGNGSNNNAPQSGAAYAFGRSGTTWTQKAYLKASNTGVSDQFGNSVAISGDTAVVGAPQEDSNATGGQTDNSASNAGAAYVFSGLGVQPINALSRKVHAPNPDPTKTFDINLPFTGPIGIECRKNTGLDSTGPNVGHDHEVIVTFPVNVTVGSAEARDASTDPPALVGSTTFSVSNNIVTVDLHNLPRGTDPLSPDYGKELPIRLIIYLRSVSDGTTTNDVSIPMGVLLGDLNGSQRTDSGDVANVRSHVISIPADNAAARFDVNLSGRTDSGDITAVRNYSLHALP
jgi:hypothetical protein